MRRPRGFTVLAVLLVLLAISGLVNAWWAMSDNPFEWRRPVLAASNGIVYALTALATAVGLWICARWALAAYAVWALSALLAMVLYQADAGILDRFGPGAGEPWWGNLISGLPLLGLGAWYIWDRLRRTPDS